MIKVKHLSQIYSDHNFPFIKFRMMLCSSYHVRVRRIDVTALALCRKVEQVDLLAWITYTTS